LAGEWRYHLGAALREASPLPQSFQNNPNLPTVLYNAMLAPLQRFPIKGAIWYQGESNAGRAKQYQTLFPLMIADWRRGWNCGEFPFLFVQIAPYNGMGPEIREAQFVTLAKSPNTAMAVTTDVGDAADIHPTRKGPVGARLALAARALAYGEPIEYSGPLFAGAEFKDGAAVVSFTHVGGGLEARGGELKGFTVAGADQKFVPAKAVIEGEVVMVSSDEVAAPVAVRYGWTSVPDVNLFNAAGLPASPFRTDVQ
jgi:sialate O-acetylesterase